MNLVDGISAVSEIVKRCITSEMVEDGILEDVKTFVPSFRLDEPFEEPVVWLFEHETTVVPGGNGALSKQVFLQTPFELVCCVYDETDMEISEIKGKDLAGRVATAIGKNYNRITVNGNQLSSKPIIQSIAPVGAVSVEDTSDEVVLTSVTIILQYYVNWWICCANNNNND